MILSLSAPLIQAANIGSVYQDLKNIQKGDWRMLHESTIFENLIWSLLDISSPYLLYFHFQVDNTQAELKHSDISAILFWVHCDFLSSAEIEGDWIKQKLQNLELVITIQMDFL